MNDFPEVRKIIEAGVTGKPVKEKARTAADTAQHAAQVTLTVSDDVQSLAEYAQSLDEGASNNTNQIAKRTEKLIDSLLPHVEDALGWAMEIYQKTQEQLASYANYDLLGPDMSGDTVYLIRVDLK